MSIRKRKAQIIQILMFKLACRLWQAELDQWQSGHNAQIGKFFTDEELAALMPPPNTPGIEVSAESVIAEVEAYKVEYAVAKVTTGEVIATFDHRDEALKLIVKHIRQKKAKLMLVDAEGVEPFTLEELQAWA